MMTQKAVLHHAEKANEDIVKILFEQDELTWQNIIYELVNTEQMDPWDIDVSQLSEKFLEMIRTLQEMDFRITGKLVLAAALLLKIKSKQFLESDLTALDSLISGAEDHIDLLEELPFVYPVEEEVKREKPKLIPRTPQPRKRKVAVGDLVKALEKALEVEMRRVKFVDAVEVTVPDDPVDITSVIKDVYDQVFKHYKHNKETLTFSGLLPEGATKEEKIYTFIPLLHLDHMQNIDLMQKQSFGEISIKFLKELDPNFKLPEAS